MADEISKGIYAAYIMKYSAYGLTIENSVDWSDSGLTRTYLSDLENEWNTWKVQAIVANPDHSSHIDSGMYRPAYICALHELMHVEETIPGILKYNYDQFEDVIEVLTVTRTLILMDEVYKKTFNLPMDVEVDYGNSFNLFGKTITQGALANFYRNLEAQHSSLAEALVSRESFAFFGQTAIPSTPELDTINTTVLNGFIAALGAAAVAIAFVLYGVPGLIVTSIAAVGFFATDVYQNHQIMDGFPCFTPSL